MKNLLAPFEQLNMTESTDKFKTVIILLTQFILYLKYIEN